jgi:hypothetical protein
MRKTSYDSMIWEGVSQELRGIGKCRVATHNGEGHDESPERSHGVGFDSLKDGHVVLDILCCNSSRLVFGGGSLLCKGGIFDFGEGGLLLGRVGLGLHVVSHDDWSLAGQER